MITEMNEKNLKYVDKIGSGTHGNVYLLKTNEEQPKFLVCKSISYKNIKYAEKELKILKRLEHIRIISFYDSIEKKHGKYIYMEYANYGDLEKLIKFLNRRNLKIKNKICWSIFAQIIDGLDYLKKHKIIHRDIKPSNILLSRIKTNKKFIFLIKIADFSLSQILNRNESFIKDKIIVGTPYYMSPEIILKQKYDYTVDIWSTGVLMYELIAQERPFEAETKADLRKLIINLQTRFVPKCEDGHLEQTILSCLKKKNRPTVSDLKRDKILKIHLNANNRKLESLSI